jgi:hypothetical protein
MNEKIIEKSLEDLAFIRIKDGTFVKPSRLCFALSDDLPGKILCHVPKQLVRFKELLLLLGALDSVGIDMADIPPVPTSSACKNLADGLLNTWKTYPRAFADVSFAAEEKILYAHKIVLIQNSEKFKGQFLVIIISIYTILRYIRTEYDRGSFRRKAH